MQSVFEKLGLTDDNAGVFDGEWRGGGAKIDKISPINGQKLAGLRTASDGDAKLAYADFSARGRHRDPFGLGAG